MSTEKKSGGLAGIVAGQTSISTVGKEGVGLTYRGYAIEDLAEKATFEEVAFLLLYGHLPNRSELEGYCKKLGSLRGLPGPLKTVLEQLPAETHPMDVLRTGCSALGCLEPEGKEWDQHQVADRLLAAFPSMLLYWHAFHRHGKRIETQTGDPTMAAHFLHLLLGKPGDEMRVRALDAAFILYAEHEFNASTFAARTTASTLADLYSAITAGIGNRDVSIPVKQIDPFGFSKTETASQGSNVVWGVSKTTDTAINFSNTCSSTAGPLAKVVTAKPSSIKLRLSDSRNSSSSSTTRMRTRGIAGAGPRGAGLGESVC